MEPFQRNTSRPIIVYCDVDGTLLPSSNHIHASLLQGIERFVQHGFGFSLATGRSLPLARRLLDSIPVNAPVVLCNGAYIYNPIDKTAEWTSLDGDFAMDIFRFLDQIPNALVYADLADGTLIASHAAAELDPFLKKECVNPRIINMRSGYIEGDILKIGVKLLEKSDITLTDVRNELCSIVGPSSGPIQACLSSGNYLEIVAKGVSKWSGILMSQQMQGYNDDSIYAVGDHHNDIEMVKHADVGLAMENAQEEVKRVANYTIGHVDDNAVVKLLDGLMHNTVHHRQMIGC